MIPIDLTSLPFTVPLSRLFVRRDGEGVRIYEAAYERSLADSVVAELVVRDPGGAARGIASVTPESIGFDGGARLVVDGATAWLGGLPEGDTAHVTAGTVDPARARLEVAGPDRAEEFTAAEEASAATVRQWLARTPRVGAQWQGLVDLCWWVLGCNTLKLGGAAAGRAVVPSKLGYVGLWQWDAYFIAIGLRHGDPDLALEQLRIAVAHQQADGQLPDVVGEAGVLASSDDLPPGDLENLRAMASPTLAFTRIPLTKPPLTALAVSLVAPERAGEFVDAILASQDWWFEHSDPGQTGLPAYLHPYSSGLDDSPIFDHDAIVRSPDLGAYLVLQDRILAQWLWDAGHLEEAERCAARAERTLTLLERNWDPDRRFMASLGERGQALSSDAVVGLMPLLAPGLAPEIVDGLREAIADPARFASRFALPTVALNDPDFSPERMWRGPVWVNTTWLVAHGLRLQGHTAEAAALEGGLLELVRSSGGPHEYFSPLDGSKPPRATTAFGWSAALMVDLAVRHSAGALPLTAQR